MTKYKLSQEFITDTNPIRSISYNASSCQLYTGSEGGIVSTIHLPSNTVQIHSSGIDNDGSSQSSQLPMHDHHITALLTNAKFTITACKDSIIRVFDCKSNESLFVLKGHEKNVTSLSFLHFSDGSTSDANEDMCSFLVSGSWDGTAKIWNLNNGLCCATLEGHENTVSVQGLPPPASSSSSSSSSQPKARLATGSAGVAIGNKILDYKIRIYEISSPSSDKSIVGTLSTSLQSTVANDHSGPIRSLSFDQKLQLLLSSSNDGSVKLRDMNSGTCVQTLDFPFGYQDDDFLGLNFQQQQPPMLLDVCTNHGDSIIACGEDGAVLVWSKVNSSIETQIIPHPDCVWKVTALPNGDVVTACHDGKIRIFTKEMDRIASDDVVKSFVDDVVKSKEQKSKGPSQDEIEKLPKWEMNFNLSGKSEGAVQVFNKNGKAIAAQWSQTSKSWIEVGEVTGQTGSGGNSGGSIDGTAYDFVFPIEIDVPGGGIQKLQIGYNNGENPFNTAQAFIDEHMLDQNYLAQIADYIRTRVGQDGYVPTIGAEGSGTTSGASPMDYTPTPPAPSFQHLPMKGYKSFETGADTKTLGKVSKKITEFNTAMNNSLSSDDVTVVLDKLLSTIAATSRYHATTISEVELQIISKMMKNWSLVHVFPGIDLARLVVLHPDASSMNHSGFWNEIVGLAMDKCDALLVDLNTIEGPAKVAIPMLSMRLIANCFRGGSGSRLAVESNIERILNCVSKFVTSDNKNVRLAVSTVILNLSSYLKSTGNYGGKIPDLFLDLVGKILSSNTYETEAIVRTLVAFGTILLVDDTFVQKAKSLMGAYNIQSISSQHGDKATSVAAEIQTILS